MCINALVPRFRLGVIVCKYSWLERHCTYALLESTHSACRGSLRVREKTRGCCVILPSLDIVCACHFQAAGVDEEAEQEAAMLLAQPAANRGPAPPAPRILNSHPLQAKVQSTSLALAVSTACCLPGGSAFLTVAAGLERRLYIGLSCKDLSDITNM